MLSDLFPSEYRSNSFAWWGIANLVGSLFVGGIALSFNTIPTTVLDAEYGSLQEKIDAIAALYSVDCVHWRDPYRLIAFIAFIFVGLCFLVKEPKRAATEKALRQVLANEKVDYSHHYKIRKEDLKFVYKRKTNIFLVLNFFDCVTSGVITTYLLMYITMELGFTLNFESINVDLVLLLLVVLVALLIALWGQFYFAKLGDKKFNSGDIRGRIKMMTYCGIFMVPFLCVAFMFSPSLGTKTLFNMFQPSGISISTPIFWIAMFGMMVLLGFGLAGSFGGTPNWYASMIDGNLPEQRGTMIAIASFSDTIGRSIGSIAGGFFLDYFMNHGISGAPIGLMLIVVQAIFGGLSVLMTIPALYTSSKDLKEVQDILKQRAEELSKKQ
jgi:MFS family permease